MIKKKDTKILTILAVILVAVSLLFVNKYSYKTILDNKVVSTDPSKLGEIKIPSSHADVTHLATKQKDGWFKYEFRKAYLNKGTNDNAFAQYENYNLYFPKGWQLSIKETNAFDENGNKTADIGGANLVMQNKNSQINIDQANMGTSNCTFDPSKHAGILCNRYKKITDDAKNLSIIQSSLSKPEYNQFYLSVCDHNFADNKQTTDDYCTKLTSIGRIEAQINGASSVDEFIEIINRIEVVEEK